MKRILSLILCVLMLVPCFAMIITAEDTGISDEYKNFALDDGVGSYGSSKWNNDSDPKYINNGELWDSYRFWRPEGVGRGPTVDDSLQYCGLKYNAHYYEVDKVVLYVDHWGPENDILYTIKALVLGEWVEIGSARAAKGVGDEKHEGLDIITIDVENVVTKNIRVECTEWGRWATSCIQRDENGDPVLDKDGNYIYNNGFDDPNTPEDETGPNWHHWWKVPIVHEVQTWGTEAPAPPWDVPDGAILSTNACLSGFAGASSVNTFLGTYPALSNDNVKMPTLSVAIPYWQAGQAGAQSVWSTFDQPYDIDNVSVNFGGSVDGMTMKYDVQVESIDPVTGEKTWETIAVDQTVTTSVAGQDDIVFTFDGKKKNATAVKVIFKEVSGGSGLALLTEMGALISADNIQRATDENGKFIVENGEYVAAKNEIGETVVLNKCVFLNDFLTPDRKQSTSVKNLACFGSAYASSVMTYANISSVDYINDGGILDENFSWFSSTFVKGTYCGVELKENYNVSKVVMYFNDPITGDVNGDCVMEVDIQYKNAEGKFVTAKEGVTSYDSKNKTYVVSVMFDAPVNTNDIRVVYNSNGMVFPYIKELEVYSNDFFYDAYLGYNPGQRPMGGKVANTADELAPRTLIPRSKYLDKISPIQYFEIAMRFGIDVLSWI